MQLVQDDFSQSGSVFSPSSSSFKSQQSSRLFHSAGLSALSTDSSRPGTATTASTTFTFSRVTEEDKMLAMLGYKDLNRVCGTDGIFYYREEFCGACGVIHTNPDVLDTYSNCEKCHCVIREPETLRKRYYHTRQRVPLEVLYATYGDPYNPSSAKEVTDIVIQRIKETTNCDRLTFSTRDRANEIFGFDPAPNQNKQLRMRYRMNNTFANLVLDFNQESRIPAPFILTVPRTKYVRIYQATYGHPRGRSSTGRMSFDVQEILQSLIDQNGGAYLSITAYTPISRMLGDPCPGYTKDLRIKYEILGKAGEATYDVIHNCLTKKIYLSSAPTIAPIVFVARATYGITPTAKKDRLDALHRDLKQISTIEHRKAQGLPIQPEEVRLIRARSQLEATRDQLLQSPSKFLDITAKVQKIVDEKKFMIRLDRKTFDPNAIFGNPCPNQPKLLDIHLDCQGHDSEKLAESNEMTDTGIARNLIAVKKGRFNVLVHDRPDGRGVLSETIEFSTSCVAPMVVVTRALYGELDDLTKVRDVTCELQARAEGRALQLDKGTDLAALFKIDPSPGRNKKLKISYISRGFTGNVRVRERDDCLVAGLELGYPPQASLGDDDHNHTSRFL